MQYQVSEKPKNMEEVGVPMAKPGNCGVRLLLKRVELISLTEIDVLSQAFKCQIYVQFRVPGGNRDRDLLADRNLSFNEEPPFPVDSDGRPTFRPGIRWYLKRIDFTNDLQKELHEVAIMDNGDDLICAMRWTGQFTESFELEMFPYGFAPITFH